MKPEPFSVRHGFAQARKLIQTDSLDTRTRSRLWNAIAGFLKDTNGYGQDRPLLFSYRLVFDQVLALHDGQWPKSNMTAKSYIRDVILKEHIKTVGQVLETLAEGFHGEGRYDHTREAFEASVNRVFEEELVGLRFSKTEHILVPLMTDEQLKAVDGAIESPDVADGAKAHL